MQNIFSRKLIIVISALVILFGGVGFGVYYTMHQSSEESGEVMNGGSSQNSSELTRINAELLKQMSVATSTASATSTLSAQEVKKVKAAATAPPRATSSIRATERQQLLDAMSAKQ